MKAYKPDGSRWFASSALDLMTAWLLDPELQLWLNSSVEVRLLGGAAVTVLHECGDPSCPKNGVHTCALCDDCGPPAESARATCECCGMSAGEVEDDVRRLAGSAAFLDAVFGSTGQRGRA